jgi:Bacterial SH3 domain
MFKLLLILVLGMFLTLKLVGEDRGQLRPGLANADPAQADPVAIVPQVETRALAAASASAPAPQSLPTATSSEGSATVMVQPVLSAVSETLVVEAAFTPEPAPVTAAAVTQAESVFTLSTLPSQDVLPVPEAEPANTVIQTGETDVWYVTARSVNVRGGPSTDDPIVGKLTRGEAALMLADTGAGWAEITIEGDGVTGYVRMDLLSQDAP